MQCSKCQAPIKPVVVLDIDGTLGDYHGHFHRFAQDYIGAVLPTGYDGSCELHEWYCLTLTKYREIKLAYRQGGMKRSMPVFPGADNLVRWLRNNGAEVWICTTRPYLRLDNIDPDTRNWLARNDIRYDGMLYSENKYERLLEIVDPKRIVAVLDDLPEMCRVANERIGPGIGLLRVAPHNAYFRSQWPKHTVVQIPNLQVALETILASLATWRNSFESV